MNLEFSLKLPDSFVTITPETLQHTQKSTTNPRCDNCSKRKKGCDRKLPCSGCRYLNIRCVYSINKQKASKTTKSANREKELIVNQEQKISSDRTSELCEFAKNGKTEDLKNLLASSDAEVDSKNSYGQAAVHLAAQYGHEEAIEMLIKEFNAKINIQDNFNRTPLHFAAEYGHKAIIAKIMNLSNVNVNATDIRGNTPLHMAIWNGRVDVVRCLTEFGADINVVNAIGLSPLQSAIDKKDLEVIRLLIQLTKYQIKDHFHRVPPSNIAFIDRPDIFNQMSTVLGKNTHSDECKILALQGLGGMGKTHLMTQYCYRNRSEYNFIFWLPADCKSEIMDSYSKLANNIGFNEGEEYVINRVRSYLEGKTKWLLLLDNVNETIIEELPKYVPRLGGHIILTTREPISPKLVKIIRVDKMNEKEAISLLLGDSARELDSGSAQYLNSPEVVKELDYIPFAIDIARAYIVNLGISPQDYLEVLTKDNITKDNILPEYNDKDEDNLCRYEHTIMTVWKTSFDRIQAINPMATQILQICAFLHSENIPISFFDKQYTALELPVTKPTSPSAEKIIRNAIADLYKFALVTRINKERVGIHRLIQRVIIDSMDDERRVRWTNSIATALNNEMKFSDSYDLSAQEFRDTYLPHIYQFARLLGDPPQNILFSETLSGLLRTTIQYSVDKGQYHGMTKLGRISHHVSKELYGPEDIKTVRSLNDLAEIYNGQSFYKEAENLYKEVLGIRKKTNDPDTAVSLSNLAGLYRGQAKFNDAKELHEELRVDQGSRASRAMYTYNIAKFSHDQGLYNDAESKYKEALADQEITLGMDHPAVVMTINNLAKLYSDKAKYDDAEKMYIKARAILDKGPRLKHPSMAMALHDMAELHRNQGMYDKAKKLYDEALEIQKNAGGENSKEYAILLKSLGDLHFDQWNYLEAEEYYKNALNINKKTFGTEHPSYASSLKSLAELYRHRGNNHHQKAQEMCKEALTIIEKALGEEHIRIAAILNTLAALNREEKNYQDAILQLERAMKIQEKVLGSEHPDLGISLSNLAKLYENQGKYDDAETQYMRALEIREKTLGSDHPITAASLTYLGLLFKRQDKFKQAEEYLYRAYNVKKKSLKNHPRTAVSSSNLALLYERQGLYYKAKQFYHDSIVICENIFDLDSCQAKDLRIKARDLAKQGDYKEAEDYFIEAVDVCKKQNGDHRCLSLSLSDLALFYKNRENYKKSRVRYIELLDNCQETYGEEHPCSVQIKELLSTVEKKLDLVNLELGIVV